MCFAMLRFPTARKPHWKPTVHGGALETQIPNLAVPATGPKSLTKNPKPSRKASETGFLLRGLV